MTRRSGAMRVLGLMSGTSADGIDVALVQISGAWPRLRAKFEGFYSDPYAEAVRAAILRIAGGGATTTKEISQLNFLLGELFAQAVLKACRKWRIPLQKIHLIGSHGQTMYHQGAPTPFLRAARIASTYQIGEPAIVAERTGITTIADFRPGDVAAGGQGAPLVPFVDYLLLRRAKKGRVALNIGGIANVTVIPADAHAEDTFAFDTGPGNMIVDALVSRFTRGRKRYDQDARWARRGRLLAGLLDKLRHAPFFSTPPPKSAGREQFGADYVEKMLKAADRRASPEDLIHTASVLTAATISDALRRFVLPRVKVSEMIVSGGGARNPLMMAQLGALLPNIDIYPSDVLGIPVDAKEAYAFAVLSYEAYHGRINNLPHATGAKHAAVLGKLVRAPLR